MFNSFMGRLDIEGGTIDLDADGASPNARIRFLSLNQGLCE